MGDVALPHAAVREQLRAALDLVVQIARRPDGRRRVVAVAEVGVDPGAEGGLVADLLTDAAGRLVRLPTRAVRVPGVPPAAPGWLTGVAS